MLADTYLLYLKTHNFHWNVEGPMFQTLHIMFMEQYTEALERDRPDRRADPRARPLRARHLQGVPQARLDQGDRRRAEGGEDGAAPDRRRRRRWCAPRAAVLPVAEEANDQPTLDLLTQRMDVHEKNAWMLRSLLKK